MADVCPFVISPVTVDKSEPRPGALQLLAALRPEWNGDNITVEPFPKGSVNLSVLCFQTDDVSKEDGIVLRCYGDLFGRHISRQREFIIMQIAHHAGCGSAALGAFQNGVAYQYASGRNITTADLLDKPFCRLISRALAQFHALDPNTVPLWDREGRRVKHFDTDPTVLKFLAGLVAEIPTHVEHDAEQNDRYQEHKMSKEVLLEEIAYVNDMIKALSPHPAIAHGDFHLYNVLYDEHKGSVSFLDFELSQPGFVAMDINQMLNQRLMVEALGYARPLDLHVTEDAKEYFMRCYLERRRQLQGKVPDEISDEEFRLFSLEQTIFRSIFFLFWIILPHKLANTPALLLDVFRFVPIFKKMYYELKDNLPYMKKTYIDLKNKM